MSVDDQRFAEWWQQVGYPGMQAHLSPFILGMVAPMAKQGAKAAWDAALTWKPTQGQKDEGSPG